MITRRLCITVAVSPRSHHRTDLVNATNATMYSAENLLAPLQKSPSFPSHKMKMRNAIEMQCDEEGLTVRLKPERKNSGGISLPLLNFFFS